MYGDSNLRDAILFGCITAGALTAVILYYWFFVFLTMAVWEGFFYVGMIIFVGIFCSIIYYVSD